MKKMILSVTGFTAVFVVIGAFLCGGCNDAGVKSGGGDAVVFLKRFAEGSDGVATFEDVRDGKKYKKVEISTQTWMAENLNYTPQSGNSWCYDYPINRYCGDDLCFEYDRNINYCDKYGRLYDWATAMGLDASYNHKKWDGNETKVQGICPDGWRLPSAKDWEKLLAYAGDGAKVRLKAKTDWFRGNGVDDLGFSALPGGAHGATDDSYNWLETPGIAGYWWSSSNSKTWEGGAQHLLFEEMGLNNLYVYDGSNVPNETFEYMRTNKMNGYSVRCLQD